MVWPRIFVGTLACGEAEFADCCRAVGAQQSVKVTHHVITDQPEFDAHNQLWAAWYQARTTHELFVKVDADTVLSRPTALAEIHALFADPAVTGAQILLHDYFTDRLIAGLNAFTPAVKFHHASSRLFADHADSNHNVVVKGEPVAHLAPIGWHCTRPHPRQAFHYGVHRVLKKQREVIKQCAGVWLVERDEPRSWALAGAMTAGWRLKSHFDYGDARFETTFARFAADPKRLADVEDYARSIIR